jgi:hypothetical protein
VRALSFLKDSGFGFSTSGFQSEPEYESIEEFGFGLTPKPATDSRPNPKYSVKFKTKIGCGKGGEHFWTFNEKIVSLFSALHNQKIR